MFLNAQKPGLIKDPYVYGPDSIMLDLEDAVAMARRLMEEEGLAASAASKKAAAACGFAKSEVYRLVGRREEE